MSQLELGQAIDYVIEYNTLRKQAEKPSKNKHEKKEVVKRQATQADWDAFWG